MYQEGSNTVSKVIYLIGKVLFQLLGNQFSEAQLQGIYQRTHNHSYIKLLLWNQTQNQKKSKEEREIQKEVLKLMDYMNTEQTNIHRLHSDSNNQNSLIFKNSHK